MKIGIGSDHAGFRYKELLKAHLAASGHEVEDFGTHSAEAVDYPVYIRPVAEAVARGECERGIVLGGSGNGEAIVANRVPGIRCIIAWNVESARLGRRTTTRTCCPLASAWSASRRRSRFLIPGSARLSTAAATSTVLN